MTCYRFISKAIKGGFLDMCGASTKSAPHLYLHCLVDLSSQNSLFGLLESVWCDIGPWTRFCGVALLKRSQIFVAILWSFNSRIFKEISYRLIGFNWVLSTWPLQRGFPLQICWGIKQLCLIDVFFLFC